MSYLPSERKPPPNALLTSTELMEYRCGEIKRLVMGLDRYNKTPCGFCFVEYYTHQDALDCLKYIGGTKLDERIIRTDLDPGFEEGRQYGYVYDRDSRTRRLLTLVDVVNRVVRSAMSTGRNTILVAVAMDVPMRMTSDDGRKRSMVRVSKTGEDRHIQVGAKTAFSYVQSISIIARKAFKKEKFTSDTPMLCFIGHDVPRHA